LPWSTPFDDPIPLPQGRSLVTLKDAADYITTMMARIGVMKALNRHVERVFNSERKATHWGKRKLKRDQLPC
jgi:hypothetical protein